MNQELVQVIAITAVITAFAKEVVSSIYKATGRVGAAAFGRAKAMTEVTALTVKFSGCMFMVLLQLLVLVLSLWDHSPATVKNSASLALCAGGMIFYMFLGLEYVKEIPAARRREAERKKVAAAPFEPD